MQTLKTFDLACTFPQKVIDDVLHPDERKTERQVSRRQWLQPRKEQGKENFQAHGTRRTQQDPPAVWLIPDGKKRADDSGTEISWKKGKFTHSLPCAARAGCLSCRAPCKREADMHLA